jgi:hypothetical protein
MIILYHLLIDISHFNILSLNDLQKKSCQNTHIEHINQIFIYSTLHLDEFGTSGISRDYASRFAKKYMHMIMNSEFVNEKRLYTMHCFRCKLELNPSKTSS